MVEKHSYDPIKLILAWRVISFNILLLGGIIFKVSIKEIAIAGIMLSLLTVIKYLDLVMPKINGLTAFEFTFMFSLIIALMLRPIVSLFVFVSAPLLWLAIGQTSSIGFLGMLLDYSLPMMFMFLVSFSKKRWSFIFLSIFISIIKLFSHTLSGVVVYGFAFNASMLANLPFVGITCLTSIALVLIMYNKITKLRRMYLLQNGYLNVSYKVKVDKKAYQLRVPKRKLADWSNEAKVYKELMPGTEILPNGKLLKPWVDGEEVKVWDNEKLDSLKDAIKSLHLKKIDGLAEFDWTHVSKHYNKLSNERITKYQELVKKNCKLPQVLSHNDINKSNVLWDGTKITLIDFEWTCLNNKYFDYVSFEIAEGINIHSDEYDPVYSEIKYMTLVYFYLWTFESKYSLKIRKLRNHYKKMLYAL